MNAARMNRAAAAIVAMLTLLGMGTPASATTVSLPVTADNALIQISPNSNYGNTYTAVGN